MPAVVIDLRHADDLRDVVHQTVQSLAEGKIVAFPTETVYGLAASALDERAVQRLAEVKGRKANHPLTLAIKSGDEARDYIPDMSPLAQRLARRCWPGPVTLVLDDMHADSLVRQLPGKVLEYVLPSKTLGLRVPGHQVLLDVLRMLVGPLALTSANRTGGAEAVNAREVLDMLGSDVDLVIDDGPCRFGEPSSVVRIQGNRYELLRAGVVPEKTMQRLSCTMVLFVCTGNTCRSPMSEAICRKLLAEKLGCQIGELEDRGALVMSAGVAAMLGGRAAQEAIEVLSKMEVDLADHETQPLTEPLVRHADLIFTMTRTHREAILAQWPLAAERTFLLSTDESDICDPIGGPPERYQRCAAQLRAELAARLEQILTLLTEMRIAVGADHRGFPIRARIVDLLHRLGHEVEDAGTYSGEAVDYPDIAARVARMISRGEADRGILICGTGLGMCIAANKFPGVRAAPCHDDLTAEMSRRHNDANILCLSADLLGEQIVDHMVEIWLDTSFEGGRHARRVGKICDIEAEVRAEKKE